MPKNCFVAFNDKSVKTIIIIQNLCQSDENLIEYGAVG